MFGRSVMKRPDKKTPEHRQPNRVSRSSYASTITHPAYTSPCVHCEGSHHLNSCPVVYALSFYERIDVLKHRGFCFGCLKRGHNRQECKHKATCSHCKGKHPSILHIDGKIPPRPTTRAPSSTQADIRSSVASSVVQGSPWQLFQ